MDIPIADLIADLGFTGTSASAARRALENGGLTNPRKVNISAAKHARARSLLLERFRRLCRRCRAAVAAKDGRGRVPVVVEASFCERCGGSDNRRAVRGMVTACERAGVRRVVFVGGSPSFRQTLEQLVDGGIELRLIDGTSRVTKASAQHDITWADLIVVCGSTELAHRVSNLFTQDPAARAKLITTGRRGIAAIAGEVARSSIVRRRAA